MYKRILITIGISILTLAGVVYAATGTIDPNNTGAYKAVIENSGLGADTTINFGKFTTQSSKNITIYDTELRGFAWGEGVGWIVMNCADTTSGCSATNGNFKVTNSTGTLGGYAWGENTGWINFGPFSNTSISRVKITNGQFGGTLGSAGYAWAQNYGWIKFDCSDSASCVETDWAASGGGGGGGGGGGDGTCTDPTATNYGGPLPCVYPPGTCTDPMALNFGGPLPCQYADTICHDPNAINYNQEGLCQYTGDYCTDPEALNYGGLMPCQYKEPFSCVLFPNDPSCVTTPYCETHPEECFPPKVPTKPEIVVKKATTVVKTIATTATGTAVSVVGVAATGAATVATVFIANPFSLYDIFLILARLWSLLLTALGLRKRSQPWGVVYDSVTKEPIDPAYVVLMDAAGNEVATSITDIEGRYGFSVPAGTYTILANKTNYDFPSKKLAGKIEDELYGDLYFGGPITVTTEGGIIAKNIPLDQQNFDWNQYAKDEQHRLRSYKRRDVLLARISNIAFFIGLTITALTVIYARSTFNTILLGVYLVMLVSKMIGFRLKPKGSVADNVTNQPLPFSVVRVISTATEREVLHKVADARGKFYILLPNGEYKVVVDRKNADESYTPNHIPDPVNVSKGFLKKDFRI